MYTASDAAARQAALFAQAAELERAWVAKDPDARAPLTHRIPSPVRPYQANWADSPPSSTVVPDHPPCPRCGDAELASHSISEGVRHGGDAWGTSYALCPTCGWTCWWRWDEY